jgi:hypothetical protein
MPTPTRLTPEDDAIPPDQRTTPHEGRVITLELTDSVVSTDTLPRDLNFALFKAVGGAIYFNVSYTDGTNEDPGNLTASTTDTRRIPLDEGEVFELPQGTEFNKVYAKRQSGSAGSATLKIYPGRGLLNELEAEV